MKKISVLLVVIILVLCFSSCKTDGVADITADTIEVYMSSDYTREGEISNSLFASSLGNAEEQGLSLSSATMALDNAPPKKTIAIDGDNIELQYTETECFTQEIPFSNSNRAYDKYAINSDDHTVSLDYVHGTDTLCFYWRSFDYGVIDESAFTEEVLKETAEKFLSNTFKINNLNEYLLNNYYLNEDLVPERYSMFYVKRIHGYATEDVISISIGPQGEVISCNAKNYGKIDGIEKEYSKEKIDAVCKALEDKISSFSPQNLTSTAPTLTTNIYGDLFLEISVMYDVSSGNQVQDTLYAKIPK